jgi:hypothetical protein
MRKNEIVRDDADDMLPEYDFTAGVRGKYARDFARNRNIRILSPDLLETFPDSESVNEALHMLVRITSSAVAKKLSAKTARASKPAGNKGRP